jgi:putative MATE family efflux protein
MDLLKGSILRTLIIFSWPMVLLEALFMIGQVVDMIWVGKLGPSAIAGVGLANICILVLMSMDVGLIMGVRAIISRYTGSGDMRGVSIITGQAIILGASWGILVGVIGILMVKPVFGLFGAEPEVTREGVAYLRVFFAGWVAIGILIMGMYSVQATGDSKRPMIIEVSIRTVHLVICPFLVFGWSIFPKLGVAGAAAGNVIAHSLGVVIVLFLLFSGRTRIRLTLNDLLPRFDIFQRILKVGIPALVMHAQKSFGDMILAWIIVPFGTLAVAAHSLVLRVEMIFIAIGIGLGGGAGVIAGQNLGANQPKRAEKSGWQAVGLMEVIMIASSVAILLNAEYIIGIFTFDSDLVELGGIFLRIATAGYLGFGLVLVFQDCIASIGDTVPTMIMSIAMIWIILLPLAYFLPGVKNLGIYGVRWAIVASMTMGALFYLIYFMIGRWKSKKV